MPSGKLQCISSGFRWFIVVGRIRVLVPSVVLLPLLYLETFKEASFTNWKAYRVDYWLSVVCSPMVFLNY